MEAKHIRIEHPDAVASKKELLITEMNILKVVRRVINFKNLRKKEFTLRAKIKTDINSLRAKIKLFESSLPKEESKEKIEKKIAEKRKETRENFDIQMQLEEIQSKLNELEKSQ